MTFKAAKKLAFKSMKIAPISFWVAFGLLAHFFSNKQPTTNTQIYQTSPQTAGFFS